MIRKTFLAAACLVIAAACGGEKDTGATASDTIEPGSAAEAVSTDTGFGSTGGGTDSTGTQPMTTDPTATDTVTPVDTTGTTATGTASTTTT